MSTTPKNQAMSIDDQNKQAASILIDVALIVIGKCDDDDVKAFCASLEGVDTHALLQTAKRIAL